MKAQGINFKSPNFWPVGQYKSVITLGAALTGYAASVGVPTYLDEVWIDRAAYQEVANSSRREAFAAELRLRRAA